MSQIIRASVRGPNSATDKSIVRFDGTTGKLIQNSGATLSDSGTITLPNDAKLLLSNSAQTAVTSLIQLTGNQPTGKLGGIKLQMTTAYDRVWEGWYDQNGRLQTMAGWHDLNYGDDEVHHRYEIKTANDPLATSPLNMLTRFSINSDVADSTMVINAGAITLNTYVNNEQARTIQQINVDRQNSFGTTGVPLRILAGGAVSGGTNLAGGDLLIGSGISTGSARAGIQFYVTRQGSSGVSDNSPAQAAYMANSGSNANNMVISLHNSASLTGINLSNAFIISGQNTGGLGAYRNQTSNTAGNGMKVQASGATSLATDKAGGDLNLQSGISTGTGSSSVIIQTPTPAGSTSTSDNSLATRMTIDSTGVTVNSNKLNVSTAKTPSSASDTGTTGDIAWDATYFYICVATNTWHRVAHATW